MNDEQIKRIEEAAYQKGFKAGERLMAVFFLVPTLLSLVAVIVLGVMLLNETQ